MRIGLLTGGGDCPGLNAVIRAAVRRAEGVYGHTVIGVRGGWKGMAEGNTMPLTIEGTRGIHARGGTILGTARYHPDEHEGGMAAVLETAKHNRMDAVICVGGDGTLSAAGALSEAGLPVVGVPKTIDNDVVGTDVSVGFDTAVTVATEAVDRLQTTAESHNRIMVVEVMGRSSGWIAVSAGIAGGSEITLIPEKPFDIAEVASKLRHRHMRGIKASVIVVAEGAAPAEGTVDWEPPSGRFGSIVPGAVGELVRHELELRTGFEARLTVLGHVQRGGIPTQADRVLGSRFGVAAVDVLHEGDTGVMVGSSGSEIVLVPLSDVANRRKAVPSSMIEVVSTLSTM